MEMEIPEEGLRPFAAALRRPCHVRPSGAVSHREAALFSKGLVLWRSDSTGSASQGGLNTQYPDIG